MVEQAIGRSDGAGAACASATKPDHGRFASASSGTLGALFERIDGRERGSLHDDSDIDIRSSRLRGERGCQRPAGPVPAGADAYLVGPVRPSCRSRGGSSTFYGRNSRTAYIEADAVVCVEDAGGSLPHGRTQCSKPIESTAESKVHSRSGSGRCSSVTDAPNRCDQARNIDDRSVRLANNVPPSHPGCLNFESIPWRGIVEPRGHPAHRSTGTG